MGSERKIKLMWLFIEKKKMFPNTRISLTNMKVYYKMKIKI